MRLGRLILVLLICTMIFSGFRRTQLTRPVAKAQTSNEIRYGLVYKAGGRVYLAKLFMDNTWQVDALPGYLHFSMYDARLPFGQYDVFTVAPRWMADGRLLATGVASDLPDDSNLRAIYLYEIDIVTAQVHPLVEGSIIDEETLDGHYEALDIRGLSDDGQYLMVNAAFRYTTHIVNLQSGVSQDFNEQGMRLIRWQDKQIYLYAIEHSGSSAYLANMETGEIVADLLAKFTDIGQSDLAFGGYPVGDGRWIFAYPYFLEDAHIWLYDSTRDSLVSLAEGYAPKINETQNQVAFLYSNVDGVGLLDLDTGEVLEFEASLDPKPSLYANSYFDAHTPFYSNLGPKTPLYYWEGDNLFYWDIVNNKEELTITQMKWTGQALVETLVYAGPPAPYLIHPSGDFVLIQNEDQLALTLYTPDGTQVALNDVLGVKTIRYLDDERWPRFSEKGAWLFLDVTDEDNIHHKLVYNWRTNLRYEIPRGSVFQYSKYGNMSPDESWLLIQVCADDVNKAGCGSYKLLAIHPESGTEVVLAEKDLLDNSMHSTHQVLLWSPVLSNP